MRPPDRNSTRSSGVGCFASLVTVVSIAFAPLIHSGDCNIGSIELVTQAQVDNFQETYGPGCVDVDGSIFISGPDVENLDGLSGIWRVQGHLELRDNPILADIGGISSLTDAGRIAIRVNPQLQSLHGLGNLISVSMATTFPLGLVIAGNDSLESLSSLSSLAGLAGRLEILDNPALKSIDGFTNLALFDAELVIQDNGALTDISSLTGVVNVSGDLAVLGSPLLASLQGLHNVSTVSGSVVIGGLSVITNLDELSQLDGAVQGISIGDNALLENLDGLSGIDDAGHLTVEDNPSLQDLGGVSQFVQLEDAGLRIVNNDLLTDLDELSSLRTLGAFHNPLFCGGYCASLVIENNDNLQNVDGLGDLDWAIGSAEIFDNVLLSDCTGLEKLLNGADDGIAGPGPGEAGIPDLGRQLTLSGNAEGCNSTSEFIEILEADGFE